MIAGADEVGRGSFAGPVVSGCVVFHSEIAQKLENLMTDKEILVDDSKKLNGHHREIAGKWILENSLAWGIGIGEVSKINKFGIVKATRTAFRMAVIEVNKKLMKTNGKKIEYLFLDAYYVPYIRGLPKIKSKKNMGNKKRRDSLKALNSSYSRQLAIVKGDQRSISIAAGSIIAKVYRDNLMTKLGVKYKQYNWGNNKGYGTKEHRSAITEMGVTKHHRLQFVEKYIT